MLRWFLRLMLPWIIATAALWISSNLFDGMRFDSLDALALSGLLLALVNTFIKPIVTVLTLPITVVTLGFFYLVVNALMLKLVDLLVAGFQLTGFWTAVFAALIIGVVSSLLGRLLKD